MEQPVLTILLIIQCTSGLVHLYFFYRDYVFLRSITPSINPNKPDITVLIAAHNESKNLSNLIPQLLKQDYPNFNILVVLDRCSDDSLNYLESQKEDRLDFISISEVPKNWNPKKYALDQGIRQITSDWILLTDADCFPSKKWISEMSTGMSDDKNIVIGVSPYTRYNTLLNHYIQFETLVTASRYISATIKKNAFMAVGRNFAYRKSLFISEKGFHQIHHIMGGDDDLFLQKISHESKISVVIGEKSLTYSIPKRTWKEYLQQKSRHLSVGKYYKPKFKRQHSIWFTVQVTFWLSFLFLVSFNLAVSTAFSMFLIVFGIKGLILQLTAKRLGLKWNIHWLIIVDVIYAIGLPIWTLKSVLNKNIRWN